MYAPVARIRATRVRLGVAVCLWHALSIPALAQMMSEPPADARLTWGALTLKPTVSIVSGIDTNVLNDDVNPTEDFYSRTNPEVQGWLRVGRTQVQFRGGIGAVYFAKSEEYRSVNVVSDARFEVDLARVVPFIAAGYTRTRDRMGFEIDSRPLRIEPVLRGGLIARLGGSTDVVVGVYRSSTGYGAKETFEDTSLRDALNRTRRGATAGLRYRVTPLTTVAMTVEAEEDRFEFTALRDSDSLRVVPSVEFQPDALISGTAAVGMRRFTPRNPDVAAFTGLVAALDLRYVLRGTTQLSVGTNRDVTYSFEPRAPYYLLTAWQAGITQAVTSWLQLSGYGGRQRLDYRALNPAFSDVNPARVDIGTTLGGAVQLFTSSRTASFGVTVDYARRASGVVSRGYDGVRYGVVINYGL